jgi:hypothetical protein
MIGLSETSEGLTNDVVLGTLEVEDGARIERDFEVRDFPGTVALSVLVNGKIAAGVSVALSMPAGEQEEPAAPVHAVGVTLVDGEEPPGAFRA